MYVVTATLTCEVTVCDSEVEGTEGFGGDDAGAVLEVRKALLQFVVHVGPKGKVVDKHNRGRDDVFVVLFIQEVSLDEMVLAVLLAIPTHPPTELHCHALHANKLSMKAHYLCLRTYKCQNMKMLLALPL